jgi:hypothetical protein
MRGNIQFFLPGLSFILLTENLSHKILMGEGILYIFSTFPYFFPLNQAVFALPSLMANFALCVKKNSVGWKLL